MLQSLPAHWQLEIPSRILALITLLLLARLGLELTFGVQGTDGSQSTRSRGLLVRGLILLTNPIVRAVGTITPRIVPGALVTPCAIFWILTLRIALAQVAALMAMRR
jgi:hypothetical protein